MAAAFSIRAYVESMRDKMMVKLGHIAFIAKDLPPMEIRRFRWWEHELAAIKASEVEHEEEAALWEKRVSRKRKVPKKRSISDLFAATPCVDLYGSSSTTRVGEDEKETLSATMRCTKKMRQRRRVEANSSMAFMTTSEAVMGAEPSEGETSERKTNSARMKTLVVTNRQDELGAPEPSEEPEADQNIDSSHTKVPYPKGKKHRKMSSLQKKKADKKKYIESRKAIKVGKHRYYLGKPNILKKYVKHTSVKMVKEKHHSPKHVGVIELRNKSVKRVKFAEAHDIIGSSKQSPKTPQLEGLLLLDAMPSSSSTDMSSEGDRHMVAESSTSHMPEKAFTEEANEKAENENCCNMNNTGPSELFDLNEALSESTESDEPYISNSDGPNVEHTQVGTLSMDEQALKNGRDNQKHDTELDTRAKGKSPYAPPNHTAHDSVQLQRSCCSISLHHGSCQISSGGELLSCHFGEFSLPHSAKPNSHSEMKIQQESWPAAGHTFRLMGKDLTVSTARVSYLPETLQKHTDPEEDNLHGKMVMGLPQQGRPFLSLQSASMPTVSLNTANTVHDSPIPSSRIQEQFGHRTPYSFSQPLPAANLFSVDQPYEDMFRNSANSESCENLLLGCPPSPNHCSEAFLQNSRAPRDHYSDQGVSDSRFSSALPPSRYADTGAARAVPKENSNASSSSRHLQRSGPVKLSARARHILMTSEGTTDDDAAPLHSGASFGSSSRNVSARRGNGTDFLKL